MKFLPDALDAYVVAHSAPEPALLAELDRETHLKALYPRMLSGHYQGRVLAMFSRLLRPRHVLEIGTYTGYSCISLAEGLAAGGHIDTIELDENLSHIILPYLEKAGIKAAVTVHFGEAATILPTLRAPYELVFLDADKDNYLRYYEMVLPQLPSGAVILADNVLWSGRILEADTTDKETAGLRRFNAAVAQDPRVEVVLLPVRDGLSVIRKR